MCEGRQVLEMTTSFSYPQDDLRARHPRDLRNVREDSMKANTREAKLRIVVGVWCIALGTYSLTALFLSLAEGVFGHHVPIVLAMAASLVSLGAWLTTKGLSAMRRTDNPI